MTITQENYLDFGNLLINELFGTPTLFIIVGIIIIWYLGVKNSLPVQVLLAATFLFIGAVISYAFNSLALMLIVLIIGLAIYALLPRAIQGG